MDPEDVANLLADLLDVSDPQELLVDEVGVSDNARTGGAVFDVTHVATGSRFQIEVTRSAN